METLKSRKYNLWIWTKSMSPEKEKNSLISLSLARSEMFPTFTVRVCSNTWTNGKKNIKKRSEIRAKSGQRWYLSGGKQSGHSTNNGMRSKGDRRRHDLPAFCFGGESSPLWGAATSALLCLASSPPRGSKKGERDGNEGHPNATSASRGMTWTPGYFYFYILFFNPAFLWKSKWAG